MNGRAGSSPARGMMDRDPVEADDDDARAERQSTRAQALAGLAEVEEAG